MNSDLWSQTWDGGGDGINWSSPNNWSTNAVPASSGAVIIPNGFSVTVDGTYTCASLTFNGANASLIVNSTLTVSGAVTLNNAANALVAATISGSGTLNCGSINVGNGTGATTNNTTRTHTITSTVSNMNVTGNLTINSYFVNTNRIRNGVFNLTSGNLTVNGNIVTSNSNTNNISSFILGNSSPTLFLSGASPFTISGTGTSTITLDGTGSTVNYNGAAQAVRATTYYNLTTSGSGAKTLGGDVTISNQLTLSAGTLAVVGNTLTLNGPTIAGTPASLSTTAASSLVFGGSSTGVNIPSSVTNLTNLTFNNSAVDAQISMNSNISISGLLTMTAGDLVTGSNYLAVTNTATAAITGYSATSYIYGNLRRTLLANRTANATYIFPIGEAITYEAFELVNVTTGATTPVIGTSVTSSPAASTGDVTITSILPRNWFASVISGNFTSGTVRLTEATAAGSAIGISSSQAGPYTSAGGTWTAATIATTSAILNASFPAYFAVGTPVIPTYYSYQNGNWNSSSVWTLDPSGTTWVNPSGLYPTSSDNAYILNGRTITAAGAIAARQLSVEDGGILDLVTYAGSFTTVTGNGLIRINALTFPTGDFTSFVSSAGGTIEYYNVSGNLPAQATYNNLYLTKTDNNATSYGIIQTSDITVHGNLKIDRTQGTGIMTFTIGNSTTARILLIDGTLTASNAGCNIRIGNFNARHTITIGGDLINSGGDVRFTNQTTPNYTTNPTTGMSDVRFISDTKDQNLVCNGVTYFHRLEIAKGSDQTYILNIDASNSTNFQLMGPNNLRNNTHVVGGAGSFPNLNALGLLAGTVRIGQNINIPSLSTGGGSMVYLIDEDACLWIDGGTVTNPGGTGTAYSDAILVYGTFKISNSASTLNDYSYYGFTMREKGTLFIQDGTVNTYCVRSSSQGTPRGGYIQTGGTLNIDGALSSTEQRSFSLCWPDQSFTMSGGVINILSPKSTAIGSLAIGADSKNISVTGGTVNLYATASTPVRFTSTAPFWNLVLKNASTTQYTCQIVAWTAISNAPAVDEKALVVLNDFTISDYVTFNTGTNQDVTVNRDFFINSNAIYTPGTNTTKFNGTTGQEFQINGTITGGMNNLTISNTSTTVITASAQKTLTVNGTLTISALCSLEDYGNIINALGTVYNSGTHISNNTGLGKIVLNGTATQQIQGDGNGIFGNLELNNSVAAGTDAARFYANQIVTNTLTLTNGILNIDKYKLSLYNNTTSALSVTSPGANKMIKTAGNQSDGGVLKIYDASPNNTFTFPVGTSTGYSPATITVTATNNGNVIVKPVGVYQPYATYANNPLNKYWKVESEYFSGVTAVTHQYNYIDPGDIQSAKTDAGFVRAICKNYTWSDFSALTTTEKAANQINFTTTFIDGDYTAGDLTAFTPIVTYYSKASGNWSAVTTWSTSSHNASDPDPATPPTSINPVVIGDGTTYNHTVTVTANGAQSGSLQLNTGSILDLVSTTNHNFGMLPNQVISGAGKLRISSLVATAQFPAGDFGAFIGPSGGTVEYYTNGTSFTLPTTSWTTGLSLANYYNLNLMATGANTITLPNLNMTTYNDLTTGSATYTNNVLLNATSATSLTINGNLNVNGGILRYQNGFAQSVIVAQNATIANGATFEVLTSGTVVVNTLTISGDLTNNGTLTLLNGTRYCNLTFKGNTDNSFTGTNASASTTLNLLTINKGTTQSPVLNMDVAGTLNTLSNNWLTLSNGTFRFAVPSKTITLTNITANTYSIPATACLSVNATGATIMISNINSNTSDLLLSGKLEVKTGTVNIGRATMADANDNDIEYASAGTPEISVETGGILNVNGQIRYSVSNTSGALIYNQSGGDVVIWGHNDEVTRAKFAVHNTGSIFNMSGGTITIKSGGGTTYSDVYIRPDASTVTGGTLSFDATTMGNQTYKLDANTPIYSLTLIGATSNTVTLEQTVSKLELLGSLSIDANSTFNTNDLDVSIGGHFTKSGTYNYGTNTTTFNGSGDQNMTLNNTTSFNKLTIDKSSGSVNLLGTNDPTVNSTFSLLNGTFDTKNRNIFLTNDVVNSGTHVSTGTGIVFLQGGSKQTISGDGSGSFANITLNNINGIDLIADLTISKQLYLQNGMFYIDKYLLTFAETAPQPSGYTLNKFITTSGVSSDAGVRKMVSLGNSSFIFPIGSLGSGVNKYTPATYTFTGVTGTSPYIQVRPINMKHYATTDAAAKELTYYWNISTSDDFAATALSQVFTYLQSDVPSTSTETAYISGRLPYGELVWIKGTSSDVDETSTTGGTITFNNIDKITGNYTAGETTEFGISPRYRSRTSGNWNAYTTWEKNTDGGTTSTYTACTAGDYPIENQVIIQSGHTVTATGNGYKSIYLQLYGTLDLGVTNSHNFISLIGNGRLKIDQNSFNAFIFPGGDNSEFMNTTGSIIEYYASLPAILPIITTYQNIELSGAGTKALPNIDLTIKGSLTMLTGCGQLSNATYGKNILINGNWLNNTTTPFIPGTGTVTFNGTSAQQIAGTGTIADPGETFYNVIVNNTNGLSIVRNINIKKDLTINAGCSFTGSTYTICIQGNWTNNSNTKFIANTSTVNFNGTSNQTYFGLTGETFNNLIIGSASGLTANCNTTITGNIDFTTSADSRKFKIGSKLLNLSSTTGTITNAGANKFIQTNGLSSDAGIIKSVTGSYNFTFPIGVSTKYTPAQFNETGAGGTGTIKVIPVSSKHPFANNNLSDELQYYWIVEQGGSLIPVSVTHTYTFNASDTRSVVTNYVSARFYNNNWSPVGGNEAGTSVSGNTINFTNKNYLDGFYTCGTTGNFSTVNTYYSRDNATNIATTGADWRNLRTWSTTSHSDNIHIPNTIPNANSVIIKSGHKVVSYDDGINISNLTLNGELQLNATASHTFGSIAGTGKLSIKNNTSNQFVLPTANLATFTSSTGGTIEYNGNGDLPVNTTYNNLVVTNTGAKNMPNANLTINGNLQIDNGQLNNVYGMDITILKNWVDNVASGGFTSTAGKVTFNGTVAQTITTNVNGKFFNLEINNSNGLTLQSPVEVTNNLILTSGKIVTASGKELVLSNSNSNIVSGAGLGTTSFVNGPLNKNIAATGSFVFPIGSGSTYHPLTIRNADADVWQAQYYLGNYNSTNFVAPIGAVSNTEYWRVKSATETSQANISLPYNTSGISTKYCVVQYSASNLWNNDLGSTITTATSSVATNSKATFNISSGIGNYFTVGSTNLIEWIGGISDDWFDVNNWSTLSLPGLTDNVKIPVVAGPNFYPNINSGAPVCFNLTNEIGATFQISGTANFYIYGNWTNNGTFNATGSSNVFFVGSNNQTISGSSIFNNVTINNTGTTGNDLISLAAPNYINHALTLTNGILVTTASNPLIFNDGATSTIGNLTGPSFIYGPVRKIGNQNFTFPVGDIQSTNHYLAQLGINNATGVATDDFTVSYSYTPALNNDAMHMGPAMHHVSYLEVWEVTRNVGTSAPSVTLHWNDGALSGINDIGTADLRVAHYSGGIWNNMGGGSTITGTVTSGTITSTVNFATGYSPITFGSETGVNPLPISLKSFTGNKMEDGIELNWISLSETNNDYYELQHSTDGVNFEPLTTLKGAGNSDRELSYSFIDDNPNEGVNFYRLKQVDFDGKSEIFTDNIVIVQWHSQFSDLHEPSIQIYPNPYQSGDLMISLNYFEAGAPMSLAICSMSGQVTEYSSLIVPDNLTLNLSEIINGRLSKGIYLIRIVTLKGLVTTKLVVH